MRVKVGTNKETTVDVKITGYEPPRPGKDCTCGHIACVCDILSEHEEGCRFRRSATCAVAFECEHGFDVCPDCDPCTCKVKKSWRPA